MRRRGRVRRRGRRGALGWHQPDRQPCPDGDERGEHSEGGEDENPGIEDYIGRGDATLVYSRSGHEVSLMARHSLRGGDDSRGAVQLDWGFPLTRTLRGHVQVFDGYGESLIDYNHKATYVGLGVSLQEWFEPHLD